MLFSAAAKPHRRGESRSDFNVRVKYYPQPDGSLRPYQIIIANKSIFDGKRRTLPPKTSPVILEACEFLYGDRQGISLEQMLIAEQNDEEGIEAAIRNYKTAHRRLFDKIQCNQWLNLFVTLTLDREKISRTDYDEIIDKLSTWLDNRVRRDGLGYILVPEYHKDGRSIHFHGLMNENALHLVNSGHKRNGKTVYNIQDFPYGFTTAIRITSPKGGNAADAISKYVHKYMTKALKESDRDPEKIKHLKIGGRYYLSGGALQQPQFKYARFGDVDFSADGVFTIEDANLKLAIITADDSTFSSLLKRLEESRES